MTRVLPLPAPARTSIGPSPAVTASRCGGFRSSRRRSASNGTGELYLGRSGGSVPTLPPEAPHRGIGSAYAGKAARSITSGFRAPPTSLLGAAAEPAEAPRRFGFVDAPAWLRHTRAVTPVGGPPLSQASKWAI